MSRIVNEGISRPAVGVRFFCTGFPGHSNCDSGSHFPGGEFRALRRVSRSAEREEISPPAGGGTVRLPGAGQKGRTTYGLPVGC